MGFKSTFRRFVAILLASTADEGLTGVKESRLLVCDRLEKYLTSVTFLALYLPTIVLCQ
jgi:hypothetical protein